MALALSRNFNVRRLRMMTWALTLVVGAAAGVKLWEIYRDAQRGRFQLAKSSSFDEVIAQGTEQVPTQLPQQPKVGDFRKLWESPINGYLPPKPTEVTKEPEQAAPTTVKPIAEVIEVRNILYRGDGESFAFLLYKDETPSVSIKEKVVEQGYPLKYPFDDEPYNGSVVAIRPDGVDFSWGGETFTLRPQRYIDAPDQAGVPTGVPGSSAGSSLVELNERERQALTKHAKEPNTLQLGELGPDNYLVGERDRHRFANNTEAVFREVRIGEVDSRNGKEVVFRTVRPTLQRSYGVQNADVLISINGQPVTSKAQAINYVRQNSSLSKYDVLLRRKGKEVRRTFYVPRD